MASLCTIVIPSAAGRFASRIGLWSRGIPTLQMTLILWFLSQKLGGAEVTRVGLASLSNRTATQNSINSSDRFTRASSAYYLRYLVRPRAAGNPRTHEPHVE